MKMVITLALIVAGGVLTLACLGMYAIEKAWKYIFSDWR